MTVLACTIVFGFATFIFGFRLGHEAGWTSRSKNRIWKGY